MPVYLDHAASTPLHAQVARFLADFRPLGNPSSVHSSGQQAKQMLEGARDQIAAALHCDRQEVVFTSGGTEANNLAVLGLFEARNAQTSRPIVLTAGTEHHAVLDAVEALESKRNALVQLIPVQADGQLDLTWLNQYLSANADDVALAAVMLANNETGAITDLRAVVNACNFSGIPVHTDAVAAVGHMQVHFDELGVATLAFTGHKLGGPVGVGALLVGRTTKLAARSFGGGQERGLRAGTQDVRGAAALALAVELAVSTLSENRSHWEALRSRLIEGVRPDVPDVQLVGPDGADPATRLSNIVDFVFPGCAGDSLLFLLDTAGVEISNGSACTAGVTSASHVLLNMGFNQKDASSCVRVSFGVETSEADVDAFLAALPSAYEKAKKAGFTV